MIIIDDPLGPSGDDPEVRAKVRGWFDTSMRYKMREHVAFGVMDPRCLIATVVSDYEPGRPFVGPPFPPEPTWCPYLWMRR